jgi:hypothetical protein
MAHTPTARFFMQARGLRRTTLLIEAAQHIRNNASAYTDRLRGIANDIIIQLTERSEAEARRKERRAA